MLPIIAAAMAIVQVSRGSNLQVWGGQQGGQLRHGSLHPDQLPAGCLPRHVLQRSRRRSTRAHLTAPAGRATAAFR